MAALLSIIPIIFLSGCSTASFADDPHADDVPANYRTQIAAYMRTQRDADLLVPQAFPHGISKADHADISDPNRKPIGKGIWVCVRIGDNGSLFSNIYIRAYGFIDGQLEPGTGNMLVDAGVLVIAAVCGANPNFKPFPEAEFQPQAEPRT
ncbi:MAG TPA: hypothetical protein VGJ20_30235 [Xanthobacteraceae bacterium]